MQDARGWGEVRGLVASFLLSLASGAYGSIVIRINEPENLAVRKLIRDSMLDVLVYVRDFADPDLAAELSDAARRKVRVVVSIEWASTEVVRKLRSAGVHVRINERDQPQDSQLRKTLFGGDRMHFIKCDGSYWMAPGTLGNSYESSTSVLIGVEQNIVQRLERDFWWSILYSS